MNPGLWPLVAVLLCMVFSPARADPPPVVVVSIKPIHSLVSAIMRGVAEPRLLIDGTVPPWEYQADVAAGKSLASADLVIWSGPELAPLLAGHIAETVAPQKVIEVLANEELKILPARDDSGQRDPYFWLDSRNMLILLDELTRAIVDLDPERAPSYLRNRSHTHAAIADIDRRMEYDYREVSGIPVFFYHDTHQYFEQAYAMRVAATVASPPGRQSGLAQGLLALKGWLSEPPGHCLFTETGLPVPHLDLLLADTGVTPVELDSLGSGLLPGPELYPRLMQRNFAAISSCVRALRGNREHNLVEQTGTDARRFTGPIRPRYLLTDQFDQAVSNADFANQLQLISFGYTHCPDICPTTLLTMAQALNLLGPEARLIQPIFITLDPARDRPGILGPYVQHFHPRMLGLSGSPAATRRTAELFHVRYRKVASRTGDTHQYSMDHTASLFLLGRNGEFLSKFANNMPASEVADRLRDHLRR